MWRLDFDAEREEREKLIDELERQTEEIKRLRLFEPEVSRLNDEVRRYRGEVERLESHKMEELMTRRRNDSGRIGSTWSESPVARRPPSDAADYYGETGSGSGGGGGGAFSRFGNDVDMDEMVAPPVYPRPGSQQKNICPVCDLDFPDQDTLVIHVEECLK